LFLRPTVGVDDVAYFNGEQASDLQIYRLIFGKSKLAKDILIRGVWSFGLPTAASASP
jgi:hypothetical protein